MAKVELYHGDCLEIFKNIPDKSINLIVTDPPYNIGKAEWDKIKNYVDWCGKWLLECQRVLKDNGSFYFFHNDIEQMSDLILWIRQNTDFVFKQLITIEKYDNSFVKDLYGSQNHFRNYLGLAEYCLFYTFQDETGLTKIFSERDCFIPIKKYLSEEKNKSGLTNKEFNYLFSDYINKDGCKDRSVIEHYWQTSQWCLPTKEIYENVLQSTGYFQREYEDLRQEYESLRYTFNKKDGLSNVWSYSFKDKIKLKHPTQKPTKLIKDIIEYSSNEGDTVLDCFMGSGTTAQACYETNRNFIGMEINQKYFEIAEKRIKSLDLQPSLLEKGLHCN